LQAAQPPVMPDMNVDRQTMSPEILRKKMRPARNREHLSRVLFGLVLAIVLGLIIYAVFFGGSPFDPGNQ
jgi:hypothetical protein